MTRLTAKKTLLLTALALAGAIATGSVARAFEPGSTVKAIHVTGLEKHGNKRLHVFYVSGSEATIPASGTVLNVRAVLKPVAAIDVPMRGVVDLPAAKVRKQGFMSFNYLVLATTDLEPRQLFLRNLDNSVPSDPRAKDTELETKPDSDFHYETIRYIDAITLSQLPRLGETIQLNASKDLH